MRVLDVSERVQPPVRGENAKQSTLTHATLFDIVSAHSNTLQRLSVRRAWKLKVFYANCCDCLELNSLIAALPRLELLEADMCVRFDNDWDAPDDRHHKILFKGRDAICLNEKIKIRRLRVYYYAETRGNEEQSALRKLLSAISARARALEELHLTRCELLRDVDELSRLIETVIAAGLTLLSLEQCCVGGMPGAALARLVERGQLRRLLITCNSRLLFYEEGGSVRFCAVLRTNTTLTALTLTKVGLWVYRYFAEAFIDAVENHPTTLWDYREP